MTEEQFDELLNRYEQGLGSPEERQRMAAWLDARSRGESPFRNEAEAQFMEDMLRRRIYKTTGLQAARPRRIMWRVAAAVLLLCMVGYGAWQFTPWSVHADDTLVAHHATHAIEKLMLADGTLIWLKPGSTLTYPETFQTDRRQVTLQGEALFEVARDEKRPFMIESGDIVTRVLGTSFNIRQHNGQTEVYVLTGRVSVTAAQTQQHVELQPTEAAIYAQTTRTLEKITNATQTPVDTYVQGTQYAMNFQQTTVAEVVRRIEAKFNVTVQASEALQTCRITADFTGQSLQNTMTVIAEVLDASFTIHDDGTVTLTGKGCP